MTCEVVKTKFGNAKIGKMGYYQITSKKEGNNGKSLHRLIFEDYYNIDLDDEFPDGVHIHHIDGEKTNNEIWNLEPIPPYDHLSLHNKGKHLSKETRKKMSEVSKGKQHSMESCKKMSKSRNSTGFFRVTKQKDSCCKQGFKWKYQYIDEDGKQKAIYSVDIDKLKQKVLDKGLEWEKIEW